MCVTMKAQGRKDLGSKEANITIPDIQRNAMWEKAQGPCKRNVYLKWFNCHELLADLYAAMQNTVIKRIFLSVSHVWLFGVPRTEARHASLSMEFSSKEYWSGAISFSIPLYHPFKQQAFCNSGNLWLIFFLYSYYSPIKSGISFPFKHSFLTLSWPPGFHIEERCLCQS